MQTRLIDDLLASPDVPDLDKTDLRQARVIVADNVAQYLWDIQKEEMELTDLPNIAPPFPNFFVEYHVPKMIWTQGLGVIEYVPLGERATVGITFSVFDVSHGIPEPVQGIPSLRDEMTHWIASSDVHWWIEAAMIYRNVEGLHGMAQWWHIGVNGQGQFAQEAGTGAKCFTMSPPAATMDVIQYMNEKFGGDKNHDPFHIHIYCALLTVSFMHCKNVVQLTHEPPRPLSKKYKERTGQPLTTYRTINITPMRRILKHEGHSDTLGLSKALHICRGHFKDYSEHGLFGRESHKGVYWWESHVRGSEDAGTSQGRYKVNPPDQEQ